MDGRMPRDMDEWMRKMERAIAQMGRQKPPRNPPPFAQYVGTVTFPASTGALAGATVTFPVGLFTAAPMVTVTSAASTSGQFNASASVVTATGFIALMYRVTGATFGAGEVAHWHAVQMSGD